MDFRIIGFFFAAVAAVVAVVYLFILRSGVRTLGEIRDRLDKHDRDKSEQILR